LKGDKGDTGEKGDKGDTGANGKDGSNGEDGYTPKKGTEYWTSSDKEEIIQAVFEQVVNGNEVQY
jgi:hypothetical protein